MAADLPSSEDMALAEQLPSDALQLIAEALLRDEDLAFLSIRRLSKAWANSVLRAAADGGSFHIAQRLLLIKKLQQQRFGKRARKVVVFGDMQSGKSTLCKQLLRSSGAGLRSPVATRAQLLTRACGVMGRLVELCDALQIMIHDQVTFIKFTGFIESGLLDRLNQPSRRDLEMIDVLERLSRDDGILEAMPRFDQYSSEAHNLPRLIARCRTLFCAPRAKLEPEDDLLLYVRTTGVAELPELVWPPPAPSKPTPLPRHRPLLRLNVVDSAGKPLERNKMIHSLDSSVDLVCFVASLLSMGTALAGSGDEVYGLTATADLLEGFYRQLASRAPKARLLIVLTQRDVLDGHIARIGLERWEELWPDLAAQLWRERQLDALTGHDHEDEVQPGDLMTKYFARQLLATVKRARESDTPEAAARHRNITPRVVCVPSALDLEDVRCSGLWPDQLAIELLGGWSAVFTPAATRSLLVEDGAKGGADEAGSSGGEEEEEEEVLTVKACEATSAGGVMPWISDMISDRFARLWRAVRIV